MNPLRAMITEYIFKNYHLTVTVEVRDKSTGEPRFYDHLLSLANYSKTCGWQATDTGLRRKPVNPAEEETFVPYHRVRSISCGGHVIWSHDDPKTIPQNVPFANESGA